MPGKLRAGALLMVPLELQPCVAEMPSLQKLLPEEQHCIAFSHAIVLAVEGKPYATACNSITTVKG